MVESVFPPIKGADDDPRGDGPFFSEEPAAFELFLVKLCFDGKYSEEEVLRMLVGKGGYVSYLGTNDGREVSKRIAQGDKEAALVQEALAYQVSKEIGANAAVLCGEVDAIILTGGLAYNRELTDYIVDHVSFIAPVTLYPGENEMEALNQGGLRVLLGEALKNMPRIYVIVDTMEQEK